MIIYWAPIMYQAVNILFNLNLRLRASLVAQSVKNLPAVQETQVWSLGWEDPLEKEMVTHSSFLAWKISRTEEPGGLQSMGSQSRAQLSDSYTWLEKSITHSLNHYYLPVVTDKEGLPGAAAAAKSLQSCSTLCNLIDGSPPGSPVPGILQARTLEWVAISFSNAWKEKWKWSHAIESNS